MDSSERPRRIEMPAYQILAASGRPDHQAQRHWHPAQPPAAAAAGLSRHYPQHL